MSVKGLDMLYTAIDEVNAQTDGPHIEKSPDILLFGGDHGIDSLTLVNLIAAIEQQIQMRTGKSVVIVDESTLALKDNPFQTIGTLAAHVEALLG